jgi:hypothetical protein
MTHSTTVVMMVPLDWKKEEEKRGRSAIVVEIDPRRISGSAPKIMSRNRDDAGRKIETPTSFSTNYTQNT